VSRPRIVGIQSHPIVAQSFYKTADDFLRNEKAVLRFKIFGSHAARSIKGNNNIHSIRGDLLHGSPLLRTGQSYDYKGCGQHTDSK